MAAKKKKKRTAKRKTAKKRPAKKRTAKRRARKPKHHPGVAKARARLKAAGV